MHRKFKNLSRKSSRNFARQKSTHPDEPLDDGVSVLVDVVKFVVLDEGNPSFILDILDLSLFGLFLICKFSHLRRCWHNWDSACLVERGEEHNFFLSLENPYFLVYADIRRFANLQLWPVPVVPGGRRADLPLRQSPLRERRPPLCRLTLIQRPSRHPASFARKWSSSHQISRRILAITILHKFHQAFFKMHFRM